MRTEPNHWIDACAVADLDLEEAMRVDHAGDTYAVYRCPAGAFYATAGLCTHEKAHLADGLVIDYIVECPKHSGQFDYRTGEAKSAPVCVNLRTYPTKVVDGRVFLKI